LICLLPAYKEQVLVRDTLAAFQEAVLREPSAKVVVITTLREDRERSMHVAAARESGAGELVRLWHRASAAFGDDVVQPDLADPESVAHAISLLPTTTEVVRTLITSLSPDRFHHFVYTGEGTGKAVHLNFALECLAAQRRLAHPHTYIGIYDFDSRPEAGSLEEVRAAACGVPDAIVQPVLPVLCAEVAGPGAVADASLHVLRGLGAEGLVWWLWHCAPRLLVLWRILFDAYFVGAGLFVRADRLYAAGGFPSPVDDVPLGFMAAERGWRVTPVRHACLTQCYPDLSAAVRSRTLVFRAYCEFIAGIRRKPGRLATGTFREAVVWFSSPVILGTAAVVLIVQQSWAVLTLVTVLSGAIAGAVLAIGHRIARSVTPAFPRLSAASLLYAPFFCCWRALSAWRCAVTLLRARAGESDFSSQKTPRLREAQQ
jgi:hypothetical protein